MDQLADAHRLQAEHNDQRHNTHRPDIAAPHHHQRPLRGPAGAESVNGVGQPVQVQGPTTQRQAADYQQADRQRGRPAKWAVSRTRH